MGGAMSSKSFPTFMQAMIWVRQQKDKALEEVNLYLTYVSIEWEGKNQQFNVFIRFTK